MLILTCKRSVAGIAMLDSWHRLSPTEILEHPDKPGRKDAIEGPCVFRVRREEGTGRLVETDRYPPDHVIPVN